MKTFIAHLAAYVTGCLAHMRDALPAIEEACLKVRHALTDDQLAAIKAKIIEVEKSVIGDGAGALKKAAVGTFVDTLIAGVTGQARTSIIETLLPIALAAI